MLVKLVGCASVKIGNISNFFIVNFPIISIFLNHIISYQAFFMHHATHNFHLSHKMN